MSEGAVAHPVQPARLQMEAAAARQIQPLRLLLGAVVACQIQHSRLLPGVYSLKASIEVSLQSQSLTPPMPLKADCCAKTTCS